MVVFRDQKCYIFGFVFGGTGERVVKKRRFSTAVGVAACLHICLVTHESCTWSKDTSSAVGEHHARLKIESAKAAGKPVFLDFYTDWCSPCRVIDRDVFTAGNLATFFNENFLI